MEPYEVAHRVRGASRSGTRAVDAASAVPFSSVLEEIHDAEDNEERRGPQE
jgi:hypothetical protein